MCLLKEKKQRGLRGEGEGEKRKVERERDLGKPYAKLLFSLSGLV